MKSRGAAIKRPHIYRVVLAQLAVTLLMALAFLLQDRPAAYSALLGGLTCVLPNLYFAYQVFRRTGAHAARAIVRAFYKAEAVKFGLTAVLFTLIFVTVRPLNPISLFLTYMAAQVVHWLAPLLVKR